MSLRPASLQQAADGNRRKWPDCQPGRVVCRPCPARCRAGPVDVHANTWRYSQLVAQQRAIIVERRNTLLRTVIRVRNSPNWRLSGTSCPISIRGTPRDDLSADHAVITSTVAGPIWRIQPKHPGRASIYARWAGRICPGWLWTRSRRWPPTPSKAAQQTFEPRTSLMAEPGLDLCVARPIDMDHGVTTHWPMTRFLPSVCRNCSA